MNAKLRPYKKALDYSYTLGVFPTIELLENQPDQVIRVLVSSEGEANEGVAKIKELCSVKGIFVDVADTLVRRLSKKGNVYAIGVFSKYESELGSRENHLVLVNPSDAGNLGTILRTMLGFEVTQLAIIEPAVDLFDPRTIRASMGALFQIETAHFPDFANYMARFPGHNPYPFLTEATTPLNDVQFKPPYALIFGSEGSGLGDEFRSLGNQVRIPQSDQVDSLNLAVSVAIALYSGAIQKERAQKGES